MKITLIVSILVNLVLMGVMVLVLAPGQRRYVPPAPAPRESELLAEAATASMPHDAVNPQSVPFRWHQLDSGNDYRLFIANLRASGCPESTIADIVRGNIGRAFSWQRARLKINSAGNGPWSQAREITLINALLGNSSTLRPALYSQNDGVRPAETLPIVDQQGAGNTPQGDNSQIAEFSGSQSENIQRTPPVSAGFVQGGGWSANAGVTTAASANQSSSGASQQSEANGDPHQNSGSWPQSGGEPTSSPEQPPVAETSPNNQPASDDPYAISSQNIMAQQLEQYYDWYEPQVIAAGTTYSPLYINPDAFHPNQ